jgi:hypothetical protein
MEQSNEEKEGLEMIESMWYSVAVKIVKLAIEVYGLDEEQAKALKEVFLKPNVYTVSFYPK